MLSFLTMEPSSTKTSTNNLNNFGAWQKITRKYWKIHGRKVLERVKEWGIVNEDLRYWNDSDREYVDLVAGLGKALDNVEENELL